MIKILKIVASLSILAILLTACQNKDPQAAFGHLPQVKNYDTYDIYIPSGGSVYGELEKHKLTPQQIADIVLDFENNVDQRDVDIARVQPNAHFQLLLDPETKEVIGFNALPDRVTIHRLVKNTETGRFDYILEERETVTKTFVVEGVVYTTLDKALTDYNVESTIKHIAMNALASRLNFPAYTRPGDRFKIMYSERYFEGERIPAGSRLYYASYTGSAIGFAEGFRYTVDDEKSAFIGMYTPEGVGMTVGQYRWPLDRIQVSSNFGNRFHPIHRRRIMHNGIDYRASTGTPVYAVTSGTVITAGWNGGYGNCVEIRHDNGLVTLYAHLSRISTRKGARVARGAVIGRVGSTGVSTGPHLHFGLKQNGRYINPTQLRMVAATKLEGQRLEDFKKQIPGIREMITKVENESLSPFEMTPSEKYKRQM